jgi:galactose mutarotase-like enzyme
MNTIANTSAVREFQGFAVHTLSDDRVSLAVVPELGARIISLKNVRTQREWLWHPGDRLELFRNRPDDAFNEGPLAGVDECLPTIGPCAWRGRDLPDHGEVWNRSWQLDLDALREGILKTSVRLEISPFAFERSIALHQGEIHLNYTLTNLSNAEEPFVWAMHPLLRLVPGDRLELPPSTRGLLNGATWVDDVISTIPARNCAKAFARPVSDGWAEIKNEVTGDWLKIIWDPGQNNTLGLWTTHGGWHGHHHFAIEPTNADHDSLATALGQKSCGMVAPRSSRTWQIKMCVGSR